MIIYVDIDETICFYDGDRHYPEAIPIQDNIDKINRLYEENHTIIYWTARGSESGIDWRQTTEKQFKRWGVKYHKLTFGKPAYDILICDKSKRIEEIK